MSHFNSLGRRPWQLPPFTVRRTASASEMKQTVPWGLQANGIAELHKKTKGAGVRVAVLDTGIDAAHPDLAKRILKKKDFSRSGWGTDDRSGHGTHTAGTLAAEDNAYGVLGLGPLFDLLVGKVLGDNGTGSMDDVADGFQWALDEGADVISLSLGTPDEEERMLEVLQAAAAQGVFVVCAAGNSGHLTDSKGRDLNTVDYPGRWTTLCTCVGAHDEKGKIAEFSSRGPEVDLLAPGVNVPSCYPGNRYAYMDGTSMATPFVAGMIGLLVAYRRKEKLAPIASQADLERELFSTALKLEGYGAGHGVLNCRGAFDHIPAAPPATTPPPPPAGDGTGVIRLGGRDFKVTLQALPAQ
jgi:subtilisin family serine protease